MDAGKLRHLVQIQRKVPGRNPETGGVIETWVKLVDVWARIEPLSVREFMAAQAQQSKVTARMTIRYRPDIDHTMRAVHRLKVYNIEGDLPDPVSGMEYLTLPVSEGVNDGN